MKIQLSVNDIVEVLERQVEYLSEKLEYPYGDKLSEDRRKEIDSAIDELNKLIAIFNL